MERPTSFYDSFNAKNMTVEQVAETFVFSDAYYELMKNNHVLLLGPRGSGKTTLFKMLTLPAIKHWDSLNKNDPELNNLESKIIFNSIYIPADIHWGEQLIAVTKALINYPKISKIVQECANTTHILLCMSKTISYIFKDIPLEKVNKLKFFRLLKDEWKLDVETPSLDSFRRALQYRIKNLLLKVKKHTLENKTDEILDFEEEFYLDYFTCVKGAQELFQEIFPSYPKQKWALCFDEIELTPDWHEQNLYKQLRFADESILFKLGTSPMPLHFEDITAVPYHDYIPIKLWPHSKMEKRKFLIKLTKSILNRKLGGNFEAKDILGTSQMERSELPDEYNEGNSTWKMFRSYAKKDDTFKDFLLQHNISPDNPAVDDYALSDKILRKAKPLVLLRKAFLKQIKNGKISKRSRKNMRVFSGEESLYDMCDSNPRYLRGIIDEFLSNLKLNKSGKPVRLSQQKQSEILLKASKKFSAFISSIPIENPLKNAEISIQAFVNDIALFFKNRLLYSDFSLDPVGSFVVDSDLPNFYKDLIRIAVYHGIFIDVDSRNEIEMRKLDGKRLRLSYMLSPQYNLPFRLYGKASLKRILPDKYSHPSQITIGLDE